jgi:hypothetical protein
MKLKGAKADDLSVGEYAVFHGLFVGASVCVQRGHELWDAPKNPRRFRNRPGFSEYITHNRFGAIKSCLLAAFGDASKSLTDKLWAIRPLFNRFNANRLCAVVKSELQIPDEAMSAFQPRTTPAAAVKSKRAVRPWRPKGTARSTPLPPRRPCGLLRACAAPSFLKEPEAPCALPL